MKLSEFADKLGIGCFKKYNDNGAPAQYYLMLRRRVSPGIFNDEPGPAVLCDNEEDIRNAVSAMLGTDVERERAVLDKQFPEPLEDDITETCFPAAVLCMLEKGIFSVQEADDFHGCFGVVCHAGDNEFYFRDEEDETLEEFQKAVCRKELIPDGSYGLPWMARDIAETIQYMAEHYDPDEAMYYISLCSENLPGEYASVLNNYFLVAERNPRFEGEYME
jgi:hypothetical protein